jgi:hypothetical protein
MKSCPVLPAVETTLEAIRANVQQRGGRDGQS